MRRLLASRVRSCSPAQPLPGGAGTVPLVVYDAAGNMLLQRSRFGCNVCED